MERRSDLGPSVFSTNTMRISRHLKHFGKLQELFLIHTASKRRVFPMNMGTTTSEPIWSHSETPAPTKVAVIGRQTLFYSNYDGALHTEFELPGME